MDPVQERFQPASSECSVQEKIAEYFLFLPKLLWNKYEVTHTEDYTEFDVQIANSFTNNIENMGLNLGVNGFAGVLVKGLVSVTYAVSSVVAAPLLAVGLVLKEVSLRDSKAKNHNLLMANAPKLENINKEIAELNAPTVEAAKKLVKLLEDEFNDKKIIKKLQQTHTNLGKYIDIVKTKQAIELQTAILLNQRESI